MHWYGCTTRALRKWSRAAVNHGLLNCGVASGVPPLIAVGPFFLRRTMKCCCCAVRFPVNFGFSFFLCRGSLSSISHLHSVFNCSVRSYCGLHAFHPGVAQANLQTTDLVCNHIFHILCYRPFPSHSPGLLSNNDRHMTAVPFTVCSLNYSSENTPSCQARFIRHIIGNNRLW